MKKPSFKIGVLLTMVLMLAINSSAQVYVKIRPAVPVIVKPAPPSPVHIWIEEDWEVRAGTYVYVGGHWAAPPHPGYVWIPGHWRRHGSYGEEWIRGHWRSR